MRELSVIGKAQILIKAATGEQYGDGLLVTDMGVGFVDAYYPTDAVWVLGDWNNKRYVREGEPPLTKEETLPSRLAEALERIGVECEWLDEWHECCNCYRLLRTQPDSYSWKLDGLWIDDEGYMCSQCALQDVDACLEGYINNPRTAVTWLHEKDLSDAGYEQWEPDNPHQYANGWYEGQNDEPPAILERILRDNPDASVVFHISGVGQFDIHFTAWVAVVDEEGDEEGNEEDDV